MNNVRNPRGAGRKKTGVIICPLYLNPEQIKFLEKSGNKSEAARKAIDMLMNEVAKNG